MKTALTAFVCLSPIAGAFVSLLTVLPISRMAAQGTAFIYQIQLASLQRLNTQSTWYLFRKL